MKTSLKLVVAFILSANLVNLNAQNVKINYRSENKSIHMPRKGSWGSFYHNNKMYITNKQAGSGIDEFSHFIFSEDGNLIQQINPKINVGTFNNSFAIKDIFPLGGKLYASVVNQDKQAGKSSIQLREVDENGEISSNAKELMNFPFEKLMNSGKYYVAVSPDKSVLAVVADLPFVKEQPAKIKIVTLNTELNKEIEVILPGENAKNKTLEVYTNNKGIVFIIKRSSSKNGDLLLNVFQIDPKTETTLKEYTFQLPEKNAIYSHLAKINPNGELVITGTTNLRQSVSAGLTQANHLFYFYTKNNSEAVINLTPLEPQIETLTARDLIFNGETSFLITEQYTEESKPKPSPTGSMSMDMDYIYKQKNTYVFGMSADGMKKFQVEVSNELAAMNSKLFIQTGIFVVNNKLTLFFNGSQKKYNAYTNEDTKTLPVLVQITNDGLMQTPVLFNNQLRLKGKLMPYPSASIQSKNNQLFILTENFYPHDAKGADTFLLLELDVE